jgi:hypothetical protein
MASVPKIKVKKIFKIKFLKDMETFYKDIEKQADKLGLKDQNEAVVDVKFGSGSPKIGDEIEVHVDYWEVYKHPTFNNNIQSIEINKKGFKPNGYGQTLKIDDLMKKFPVSDRKLYRFLASEQKKDNPLIKKIIRGRYCIKNKCESKIKSALIADGY